ncbi:DNA cytosine methyltransferase [Exiguobacterium sp. SH1S21]|uniref:DNA cytosine methyltransferase n=1 Tax=Exiguobacterium sp. SH1S21 TaxID=2510953 RepID=UPI001375C3D5|nr:DNA cytosine methyltransferase [Exiguobacterium sp. SH1S21]
MKEFRYDLIDLFSGAGGLSNGFMQTDKFNIVGAVEINKAAQQTFIKNHNNNSNIILKELQNNESDITKIDFTKLDFDSEKTIVVGGPPCQGFSNANRQKNYLISGNNQLVKEFVRAIRDIKPVAFLMENVKTMHSPVHKFFVTREPCNKLNDFSSIQHLEDINKANNNPIYQDDIIELLKSNNQTILKVVSNLLEEHYLPSPIVKDISLVSFLRTLKKRFDKSGRLSIKKPKELLQIQNLIKDLSLYKSDYSHVSKIVGDLRYSLSQLSEEDFVDSSKIIDSIVTFDELNRLLTRYQEMIDEDLEFSNLKLVSDDTSTFKVQASVYSYNVVNYLNIIFRHYGYTVTSDVLDSSDFGVPQKRKRFIMMGIRKEVANFTLPPKLSEKTRTVKDAINDLEDIEPQTEIEGYNENIYPYEKQLLIKPSMIEYYRSNLERSTVLFNHINTRSTPLIQKRYQQIKANNGKNFHSLSEDLKSSYSDPTRTQNTVYLRLKYDEPSPTVVNVRKSMWQHPNKARALSVREAARLQSFQDSFIFFGRKDEQYQQVGNAVPPLLAKSLALHLLTFLDNAGE